jgi:hypothetical protein
MTYPEWDEGGVVRVSVNVEKAESICSLALLTVRYT